MYLNNVFHERSTASRKRTIISLRRVLTIISRSVCLRHIIILCIGTPVTDPGGGIALPLNNYKLVKPLIINSTKYNCIVFIINKYCII